MNLKEIDAQIAELTARRAELEKEESKKIAQANYDEAVKLYPELVSLVNRLNEIGYLPPRLAKVLTDEKGKLNPGLYIKRPRAAIMPPD